jgi:HEAT repeat protein
MKRMLILSLFAVVIGSMLSGTAIAQEKHDRTAESLYFEALRLRTEFRDKYNDWKYGLANPEFEAEFKTKLHEAKTIYKRVVSNYSSNPEDKIWCARAQYEIGLCDQALEKWSDALDSFQAVVDNFGDQAEPKRYAEDKLKKKNVDEWINRMAIAIHWYHQKVKAGDIEESVSVQTDKIVEEMKTLIRGIDKDAEYGLIHGYGSPDERHLGIGHPMTEVRAIVTELLQEIAGNEGINDIIGALGTDSPYARAGALDAIKKIGDELSKAEYLDLRANEIEQSPVLKQNIPNTDELRNQLRARINQLRDQAQAIRNNLPKQLNVNTLKVEIARLVQDERIEVRLAAADAVGRLRVKELGEQIVPLLSDADDNVRIEACRSVGALQTAEAVDRLMEMLAYDPAEHHATIQEENIEGEKADWANNELTRRHVARALGEIGKIPSTPALIDGLRDNYQNVRHASYEALVLVTGINFPFNVEQPAGSDEAEASIQEIEMWWDETNGIDVLVTRFKDLESGWLKFSPRLLLTEIELNLEVAIKSTNDEDIQKAAASYAEFQPLKQRIQDDILEIGLDIAGVQLIKYIGGEYPDNLERRDDVVRVFVAETLAKLADSGTVDAALAAANGEKDYLRRTGYAEFFGRIPNRLYTDRVTTALGKMLTVRADDTLRIQSAFSLGLQKDKRAERALTSQLAGDQNEVVRAYCAWSLGEIASPTAVDALGRRIDDLAEDRSDEKVKHNDGSDQVRLWSAIALEKIASPNSIKYLIRGRTDVNDRVQQACGAAVRAIVKNAKEKSVQRLVVATKAKSTRERIGATLLLGDLDKSQLTDEAYLEIYRRGADYDPPLALKDHDQSVRAACAEALMSVGRHGSVQHLIKMLEDPYVGTRRHAFEAIVKITGNNSFAYEADARESQRLLEIEKIKIELLPWLNMDELSDEKPAGGN